MQLSDIFQLILALPSHAKFGQTIYYTLPMQKSLGLDTCPDSLVLAVK